MEKDKKSKKKVILYIITGLIILVILFGLLGLLLWHRNYNKNNYGEIIQELQVDDSAYRDQNVQDGVNISVNESLINSNDRGKGFRIKLCSEKEIPLVSQEYHLFLKETDDYKDITPVDAKVEINKYLEEEQGLFLVYVDITSLSMNKLEEGEYRIQFDNYTVDFRLIESVNYFV